MKRKKNSAGEPHTPKFFDMLFSKIASIFNAFLILYSNFIKISEQNPEKAGKNAFSTKIAIFSVKTPKTKNCNNQKNRASIKDNVKYIFNDKKFALPSPNPPQGGPRRLREDTLHI